MTVVYIPASVNVMQHDTYVDVTNNDELHVVWLDACSQPVGCHNTGVEQNRVMG